jgi:hypothetical protein
MIEMRIKQEKSFTEHEVLKITVNLALALLEIHDQGI